MNLYTVVLKDGTHVIVTSKYVSTRLNQIKFYNDRKSLVDQHLNGPDVVAAFNSEEIRYFAKQ